MDFGEIWEEHKRFIVAVGAALLVFFIGTRIVHSMYYRPAERLDASGDRLERKLRRAEAPTQRDLKKLRDLGDELDAKLASIEERIRFEPDPRFRLGPGEDFDLVYNDRYRDVRDELLERANIEDMDLDPSIGMPETTPDDRLAVERHLEALDQIRQVVNLAIDVGVEEMPSIRVLEEGRRGFLASQTYLTRTRVEYEVAGSADAVLGLLDELQRGERFVAIADARIDRDPKEPSRVLAEIEAVTLRTDPDAPASTEDRDENRRR